MHVTEVIILSLLAKLFPAYGHEGGAIGMIRKLEIMEQNINWVHNEVKYSLILTSEALATV